MSWLPKPPTFKELNDMEIHQRYRWDVPESTLSVSILKVPGGWIYTHHGVAPTSVFVPYDNGLWLDEHVEEKENE